MIIIFTPNASSSVCDLADNELIVTFQQIISIGCELYAAPRNNGKDNFLVFYRQIRQAAAYPGALYGAQGKYHGGKPEMHEFILMPIHQDLSLIHI